MRNAFGKLRSLGLSAAPAATVLFAIAIAILSLKPGSDTLSVNLNDKLGHFIAYLALAAAATVAVRGRWPCRLAAGLIAYGLALEAAQMIMPFGRDSSWLDAAANSAGVLAGLGLGLAGLVWPNDARAARS